jgi:hypothetical protein
VLKSATRNPTHIKEIHEDISVTLIYNQYHPFTATYGGLRIFKTNQKMTEP